MRRNTRREGGKRKEEKMAPSLFRVSPFFIRLLFLPPSPVLALSLPFLSLSPPHSVKPLKTALFSFRSPHLYGHKAPISAAPDHHSASHACIQTKYSFLGGGEKIQVLTELRKAEENFFSVSNSSTVFPTFLTKK